MHTTGACRARFRPFRASGAAIMPGPGSYSRTPLNTESGPEAALPDGFAGDGGGVRWAADGACSAGHPPPDHGRSYSPYSCIHALKGEKRQKRRGSEYAEYTEYKFENPYGSRAKGLILYAFGI